MGFWSSTKKSDQKETDGDTSMSEATTIDFGEVLDISFAAKLHTQLKDEVKTNSAVNFLTADLTRIDISCLQVLASYMEYAKENEIRIHWERPGEVLKEATRLTGLTEFLGLTN